MHRARLIDARQLPVYDLGISHPFARERQLPLFDLLRTHGLVSDEEWLASAPATDAELAVAHHPDYIRAVRALSAENPDPAWLARAPAFGMGTEDNPIAPGQHAAAAAVAGATLACTRAVMSGQAAHAFNPAGGLHHALPGAASGFCVYNDLVLAAREARRLGAARVLYVDVDVHHGDGVERAFDADPQVLTFSIHETPDVRWPFTGRVGDLGSGAARGSKWNLPMWPETGDDSWQQSLRDALLPAARRFRPDLIVSQHGCDAHAEDPLATLLLTTSSFLFAARLLHELSHELCGGRWVATGGGGYQPYRVLPRAWTIVWCVMSGRPLPERLDPSWRQRWQQRESRPLPQNLLDPPLPTGAGCAEAAARNAETVRALLACHALASEPG
jgi:acetoin utilization protein AcuC